ncbi:MAG TPA: trypsin-like peptidase domain-containing protein, partial [Pirellulales bacterium]
MRLTAALVAAGGLIFSLGLIVGWNQQSPWERPAQGQIGAPPIRPAARRAPDPRSELYDTLAREVAPLQQQSRVLNVVAQLMRPTVFHIEADKVDKSNVRQFGMIEEAGSGVLIELPNRPGEQYVLTNSHVIRGAKIDKIRLKSHDGRVFSPIKFWEDPPTDVAVLAMPASGLPAARLGDSATCQIGDFVLALGSPFGLRQSVTFGIISAKGRRDLELGDNVVKFQDFLQTDAAINPGNSGGPLVSLHGEVIGINTAIASSSGGSEGIGFSIPINMAVNIAQQLVET